MRDTFEKEMDDDYVEYTIRDTTYNICVNFKFQRVVDFHQSEHLTADPYYSETEVLEYHNELDEWDVDRIDRLRTDGYYDEEIEVSHDVFEQCKKVAKSYIDNFVNNYEW